MDNLTHSLAGLALARTGLSKATRGATGALVVASNLPDVDVLFGLASSAAYLEHHRGLTHGVLGGPALAVLLALGFRLALRGSRFLPLLLCSSLGIAGHVFMDLWTTYGTRALHPLDETWYAWDLVFIVDPWVLALLLGSVLAPRRAPGGHRFATVGLGLLLAYIGGRAVLHARALDEAVARVPGGAVRRAAVLPSPIDPFRWRVLADTGGAYWTGELSLRGSSPPLRRREKAPETPLVARIRAESEVAAVFLAFSPFPWLEIEETSEGTAVTWRDLRFERGTVPRFVTRVVIAPDGRIRSQAFHF